MIQVIVHAGNFEQALRNLKRKMQRELVFKAMKNARFYKPKSVRRVEDKQESERRMRKVRRMREED